MSPRNIRNLKFFGAGLLTALGALAFAGDTITGVTSARTAFNAVSTPPAVIERLSPAEAAELHATGGKAIGEAVSAPVFLLVDYAFLSLGLAAWRHVKKTPLPKPQAPKIS